MSQKIKTSVEIDGSLSASQIANATTDTDKFLVSDGGTVKYRTGLEVLSDLGISFGTASKIQHQVKAGVAINKGQAVYVTGADGTNMIVGLASNASEGTSSKTMGLLNNTVAINGFADVITEGLLAGLNTIGATVGDPVWLGTGGNLIYGLVNKPYAPNHLVFIGIVTRVNANNGEIFVKVQNGFELEELHNVLLSNLQNKQLLTYNTSNSLWENKSIGTVLGGTSDQYVKGDGSFSSAMNSRIEVNFVATAGQTTFNTPYEVGQVDVYYNGSKLYPNEFTATDRYSIVLAVGASLNAQISIVKYVSTFSTTAIRNEAIFTTTSGQTTFSVNYAVGQVDVFYNGSKLNTSEFTATDGTSVVLGFACASGESIAIISYINQVSGANGTSNKVAKFTGVASLGDSQIDDNGTNVSIGHATNPNTYKLDVNGSVAANRFISNVTNGYGLILNRSAVTTYNGISLQTASSAKWFLGMRENLSSNNYIIYNENTSTDVITVNAANNNVSILGGKVGVGTSNLTYSFQVQKTSISAPAMMISGAYYGGPRLQVYGLDADANAWMGLGSDMSGGTYEHSIYFPSWSGNGRLSFGSYNGTTYAEKMCVNASGFVGIGVGASSADYQLKVSSSSIYAGGFSSSGGETILQVNNTASNGRNWFVISGGTTGSFAGGKFGIYNATNTVEAFTINPNGNVGISTVTDAGYKLDINGSSRVQGNLYVSDNTTTGNGVQLISADRPLITRGWDAFTSGNKTGVGRWGLYMEPATLVIGTPNDATNGNFEFRRWNQDGTFFATLRIHHTGNVGIGTNSSTPLASLGKTLTVEGTGIFQTTTGGGNYNENLRLNRTGNGYSSIIIGGAYNSVSGYTTGQWALAATPSTMGYRFDFDYSGATVATINTSGGYIQVSDRNKKKDFEESNIGLDAILGLKPTLYRMKEDSDEEEKQLGFIAQEVKEFIPQAYTETVDGFIGLHDRPIIAALVKAIQELKAEIEILKNK